jgi:hypothetical protein
VLNGIGGKTIEEAKFNLTVDEAEDWASYFNARGSSNLGIRMEVGFALLAWLLARGFGLRKDDRSLYTMDDFTQHVRKSDDAASDEQDGEGIAFSAALKAFKRIGTS